MPTARDAQPGRPDAPRPGVGPAGRGALQALHDVRSRRATSAKRRSSSSRTQRPWGGGARFWESMVKPSTSTRGTSYATAPRTLIKCLNSGL